MSRSVPFTGIPCLNVSWADNEQDDSVGSNKEGSGALDRRHVSVLPNVTHFDRPLKSDQLEVERNFDRSLIPVKETNCN
jgi:hypothetical protein